MSALGRLRGLFTRDDRPKIRVRVLLKGRIGEGWYDEDHTFSLPEGATLGDLVEHAEERGVRMKEAIAKSPHLAHTLMLNGERCPFEENREQILAEGDQVYLLAPLAGG